MAIRSNAFGRVTLTGSDAEKFKSQIRSGRVKAEAVASAKAGKLLLAGFRENGRVAVGSPAKR